MTTNEMPVDHCLEAALKVMLDEIAWFQTLDDETVERIADVAPLHTPEYEYATAELKRRADVYSVKALGT
jgi:hypothetical protein